jgi:hypothetical protein
MPINIVYEPVGEIAGLAKLAGLGEYAQRNDEMGLRKAALALQAQNAQRASAMDQARLQAQMMDQERDRMARMWGQQQQMGYNAMASQWEAQQRKAQEQVQFNNQMALQDARYDRAWEADSAEMTEGQVKAIQAGITADRVIPDDVPKYNELMGKLRGLQKQRGQVRPQQYRSLLSQWMSEYEDAGIRQKPEPTVQEIDAQRVYRAPDGSVTVTQPDGKIQYHAPKDKGLDSPEKYMKRAQASLMEGRQHQAAQFGVSEDELPPPTMEEVLAEMQRLQQLDAQFQGGQQQGPGMQQGAIGPTPEMMAGPGAEQVLGTDPSMFQTMPQAPPEPEPQMWQTMGPNPLQAPVGQPGQPPQAPSPKARAIARYNNPKDQQAEYKAAYDEIMAQRKAASLEADAPVAEPNEDEVIEHVWKRFQRGEKLKSFMEQKLSGEQPAPSAGPMRESPAPTPLQKAVEQARDAGMVQTPQQAGIPLMNSPEDAIKALKPGDVFRDPMGRLWRVPAKKES